MAKKIKEEIQFCKNCDKQTIHMKNGEEINWIMHLFLAIITGGGWVILFILWMILKLFWKGLNAPLFGTGKKVWICKDCGK